MIFITYVNRFDSRDCAVVCPAHDSKRLKDSINYKRKFVAEDLSCVVCVWLEQNQATTFSSAQAIRNAIPELTT